jgi:hypothetical protein
MKKVKNEIQKLFDECQRKYEEGGVATVIEFIDEAIRQGDNLFSPLALEVQYERCEACDANMPSLNNICLVCGQPTAPVVGKFCPEPIYFHIIKSGWDADLQRQQVEINCGENGKLLLIKTDEGFVVDVYGQNDLIDTMAIWEDTLNPPDDEIEEESGAPENFSDVEIEEFKEKWGQYHNEVTASLGYPLSHSKSDELLMEDYFWIEEDKMWYNKSASMFTPREQAIADYLRLG